MNIRTVTVELLRAGSRHNQLLSPLTQYLGVCGDQDAGVVSLDYEHAEFERDIATLAYEVSSRSSAADRRTVIQGFGRRMATILGSIPGLGGALSSSQSKAMIHLRIVISASELALLPFELSKVPISQSKCGEAWLALQPRNPVCITRHIRSVSSQGVEWPMKPRILFVVGPDVPSDEHQRALNDVLDPWSSSSDEKTHRKHLVTLEKATRDAIRDACSEAAEGGTPFTHVHVLAHGAELEDAPWQSASGVQLEDQVVSGDDLATLLAPMTASGIVRPCTVTLATCDSGKGGDVKRQDPSVAHALHEAGIPLVVASQFPLTVEGSVPFVRRFYHGQLWGEHPFHTLYDVRRQLYGGIDHPHDWASLVVYEALPQDFDAALEDLRYWRARAAKDRALVKMDASGDPETLFAEFRRVDEVTDRLPDKGPYAPECEGLRAAVSKQMAEAALRMAGETGESNERRRELLKACQTRLARARTQYSRAADLLLSSGSEIAYRKANLHWLLGQALALDVFLGKPLDVDRWVVARIAATVDSQQSTPVERSWGHVSLAELPLMRLADPECSADEGREFATEAENEVQKMLVFVGQDSEHARSTVRQLRRYVELWGSDDFAAERHELGIPERSHWSGPHGVLATATKLIGLLEPPSSPGRQRAPERKASGRQKRGGGKAKASASDPGVKKDPTNLTRRSSGSGAAERFTIEMLPAKNGDCLWIEYGDAADPHRVLIDCGADSAADIVLSRLPRISGRDRPAFELFVLTHIDSDHIDGVLRLFEQPMYDKEFRDIWFNGWRQMRGLLSVKQAESYTEMLESPDRTLPWNRAMGPPRDGAPGAVVVTDAADPPVIPLPGELTLTLLSPGIKELGTMGQKWKGVVDKRRRAKPETLGRKARPRALTDEEIAALDLEQIAAKEPKGDRSPPNGSSIAFLAEYRGRSMLLTGDAHAEMLAKSIRKLAESRGAADGKLAVDALKLSHHGSDNATLRKLLDAIDCRHYLVSTDGSKFYHPDRGAIARAVVFGGKNPTLHFNHRGEFGALWANDTLKERYGYQANYPNRGDFGLTVDLSPR